MSPRESRVTRVTCRRVRQRRIACAGWDGACWLGQSSGGRPASAVRHERAGLTQGTFISSPGSPGHDAGLSGLLGHEPDVHTHTLGRRLPGFAGWLRDVYHGLRGTQWPLTTIINPRPAGVFSRTRPAGGGGQILPPPCLTPELIDAARRARRRSKALNEKIPMHIKIFFTRSHARSRSGQRSEICVFGLLPIETGLSTVERPNSPKTLLYSRRAV